MVNYANRGSHLEQLVQYANVQYHNKGIARIDKFPTPIDPERVTRAGKVFGHYAKKSTVDYIGIIKSGTFVCFDCKETNERNVFPLKNVHQHQIDYMKDAQDMGGIAFLIVSFAKHGKYYRLSFRDLYEYWKKYMADTGGANRAPGTASVPVGEFTFEVAPEKGFCLHYLRGMVD